MNSEFKIKEYLKPIEHIKLADSSRERIKGDLLEYARFHAVSEVVAPKSVPSPFFTFFMRPAPVAFAMVLLVGTTAFYLNKDKTTELALIDDTNEVAQNSGTATELSNDTDMEEAIETQVPTPAASTPESETQADDIVAMNTRAKSAPADEAESDEMFMTTELSTGTWSIVEHQTDVEKRIDSLRALVKKYDAEIESSTKTEFTKKLDNAATLKSGSEGKAESDARANLDKASVLIGEVEATLSTLGQVEVKDGVIVDINFN